MKQIFLFFLVQRYNFFRHPAILFLHFLLNTSLLLIYINLVFKFRMYFTSLTSLTSLTCKS